MERLSFYKKVEVLAYIIAGAPHAYALRRAQVRTKPKPSDWVRDKKLIKEATALYLLAVEDATKRVNQPGYVMKSNPKDLMRSIQIRDQIPFDKYPNEVRRKWRQAGGKSAAKNRIKRMSKK